MRHITITFLLTTLFLTVAQHSFAGLEKKSPAASKPNIIYILADDLGYGDLSSSGQEKFTTPNIDKLAAEGMVFTQHYSGSTVCAPSRSSLMTGLHTGHTPVRGNYEIQPEGQYPFPADVPTIPKLLKSKGYVSGAFGKWGLGYPGSEGDPTNHFDVFYGFNCQRLGHHYYPYHLWDNTTKVILEGNAGKMKNQYAPELIHERVLDFIEDNKDKPFFCYVPSIIPHAELIAPENYMNKFRGKMGKETPWEGTDSGPEYRLGKYESQAEPRAAFAAMVALLDDQVGEIVAKVEELGLAEKTLIIFTSDNGPHQEAGADPDFFQSNGGFRGYKRDLYEGGIRVPMIAHWPSIIKPGSRSDHVSAFWDVLPTIMDLAGGESCSDIDGISFLPELIGKKQKEHDYLYWEFHERGGRVAIRKGNWKAVRYNLLKNPNAPVQLFDLSSDPMEQNDLASLYPGIVKEMQAIFKNARTHSEIFKFSQTQYRGD
ncbi:MAG: arylsulfatase [Puniceicoccaceae bacterium]